MKTNLSDFCFAIFDVEGTLIKSGWVRILLQLLMRLEKWDKRKEFCSSWTGTKLLLPRWLQQFFRRFPELTYRLDILLLGFFNLTEKGQKELYRGVKHFLLELNKMGFLIFASSGNNTKKTQELLENTGIAYHFTMIIGMEKIPKSEHIPHFAELLGIPVETFAENCLYFGDSPSDIIIARNWRVYAVGVEDSLNPTFLKKAGAKEIITFK